MANVRRDANGLFDQAVHSRGGHLGLCESVTLHIVGHPGRIALRFDSSRSEIQPTCHLPTYLSRIGSDANASCIQVITHQTLNIAMPPTCCPGSVPWSRRLGKASLPPGSRHSGYSACCHTSSAPRLSRIRAYPRQGTLGVIMRQSSNSSKETYTETGHRRSWHREG